ncbi:hypothetical protein V22_34550 [Calycomorphotria hydatis]|uniref:Uncharacterized protein n=1 Tax=Calycomorphotria hydatis TaxID=2528027 RepID=A0A517TCT5_9PLAN|nr:hypothetical protein V22_34550 [Calycomorphotria hydatis]
MKIRLRSNLAAVSYFNAGGLLFWFALLKEIPNWN